MRRTAVLVLTALGLTTGALTAVALTGCGHPFIPSAALRPAATSPAPRAGLAPGHRFRHLSPPTLGVDLYAASGYPLGLVRRYAAADVAYLRRTLGAQSAGLVWNLTDPGFRSDTVTASRQTLSPAGVAVLTAQAEAAGMTVQYRPIIRVGRPSGWSSAKLSWEGHIRPASQRAWFASLFRAELPYLRIAQRLHVSEVVTGTELYGVGSSRWWPWFLRKVRSVYHGTVSYAAVMQQYFGLPRQLPPVRQVGLDAYPVVRLPSSASQRMVTAAWEQSLGRIPAALLARTSLDEVSIPALAGAYLRPSAWSTQGRTDLMVQARWFTAACQAAARYQMRGVYFYEVRLSPEPAGRSAFPAFFQGKPGAVAIHNCLRAFRAAGS